MVSRERRRLLNRAKARRGCSPVAWTPNVATPNKAHAARSISNALFDPGSGLAPSAPSGGAGP